MILPFSTQFKDGTPTYFIDKIWAGLAQLKPSELPFSVLDEFLKYSDEYVERFDCDWHGFKSMKVKQPKLNTIREDAKDRWQPGKKIHMVVFNRSKNQFQFAPVLECKSTQRIRIRWHNYDDHYGIGVRICGALSRAVIDKSFNLVSCGETIRELALNDGFESVEAFFNYFNKDFKGKIIHWTDLGY